MKTDRRTLTIVIPCYNAEKYIMRCTSSLEGLESRKVSILFVNDGSTDSTIELLENWVSIHANASLINKENGGDCSAINTGLDNCNSDYVMFLGVDDEVISNNINEVCCLLQKNKPDIFAFSTIKYNDDNSEVDYKGKVDPLTKYDKQGCFEMDVYSLYNHLGSDTRILFTRDTSRCFKTSLIDSLRYFGKTGISSDGCFSSLVACRAKSFEFLNLNCYLWHLHGDSISGQYKTIDKMKEEVGVWDAYFTYIQDTFSIVRVPEPVIDHYFEYKKVIRALRTQKEFDAVREYEKKSKLFSNWILKSTDLSLKSRIKLMIEPLYLSYLEKR